LRVLTWNCNGALRKKYQLLDAFEADLLVIQECEDPSQIIDFHYKKFASNHLWSGLNKNKGLGVFAREDLSIKKTELDLQKLELFLPCIINDNIPLLATWTKKANSPNFGYIGQLWKFIQLHKPFLNSPLAMVVGDLNSNKRWDEWDRWWNHTDVVRELHEIGLNSAYHSHFLEPQGEESRYTLYLQRNLNKGYHIDYGFFGKDWNAKLMQVGSPNDWLTHSDHMPILFDMAKCVSDTG